MDNKNIKKAEVLKQDCEYLYCPTMEVKEKFHSVKPVSSEYMDHLAGGEITMSDYYLLEGVLFLRRATAEMVAEYMKYYCKYYEYGQQKEESPLCIQRPPNRDDLFNNQLSEYVRLIEGRLRKFVRVKLLHGDVYADTLEEKKGKSLSVYTANYYTFSFLTSLFGARNENQTDRSIYRINPPYINALPQYVLRDLDACQVALLSFAHYAPPVKMRREQALAFGVNLRERYTPAMMVEIHQDDYDWRIMVDGIHFACDSKVMYESRHLELIEHQIEVMRDIVCHYRYLDRKGGKRERIRFLIACENLKGIQRTVRLMEKYKDELSEKVFFVTSTALKYFNGNLSVAAVTMKKVEDEKGSRLTILDPDAGKEGWMVP